MTDEIATRLLEEIESLKAAIARREKRPRLQEVLAKHRPRDTEEMTPAEVQAEVGLSRPTIYRRMAAGDFPKNFPWTDGTVRWKRSEVMAWKAARIPK